MKFADKILLIKGKSNELVAADTSEKRALNYFLIIGILLITVVKLHLIGSGFLAFPDEQRYCASVKVLTSLSKFKIGAAINAVFSTDARPGDVILRAIPAAIQFVTAHLFKLNYYESNNSYPVFIFNFIIYCFILIVHFKLSKLIFKDSSLALISVLLFGSLTNSYLYIRHAMPYDESLLIFYLVIYKTIKYTEEGEVTVKKSFLLGIFSFFGYLTYPGYFPLFMTGFFFFVINKLTKEELRKRFYHSIYYILGTILCLIVFEAMSRIGRHPSYIRQALFLSTTIAVGSFEESFTYIIKYLFQVEGLTGIILMLGLIFFCCLLIYQAISKSFKASPVMLLGIAIIGLFLAYASEGYFLHKMTFYGRLLHQYFPFICIFSLFALNQFINGTRKNKLFLYLISIGSILNFGANFIHFSSISYPIDISWRLIKTNNLYSMKNVCEYDGDLTWSTFPIEDAYKTSDIYKHREDSLPDVIMVNGCFLHGIFERNGYHLFQPNDNYRLVESKPYFFNFKAYQFEGSRIVERDNFDSFNLQIKIFIKKDKQLNQL